MLILQFMVFDTEGPGVQDVLTIVSRLKFRWSAPRSLGAGRRFTP